MIELSNGKWIIQSYEGKYATCDLNANGKIKINAEHIADWEYFDATYNDKNEIIFKGVNGKFVTFDPISGILAAQKDDPDTNCIFTVQSIPSPEILYIR